MARFLLSNLLLYSRVTTTQVHDNTGWIIFLALLVGALLIGCILLAYALLKEKRKNVLNHPGA